MSLITKKIKARVLQMPIVWSVVERSYPHYSKRYRKLKKARDWTESSHRQSVSLGEEVCKKKQLLEEKLEQLFRDCVVKNGPFKGMLYPSQCSKGSELYPKLLGSYEAELHGVLNYILKQNYNQIFDIGCAEGYYAVGLAMHLPNAKVSAYDIDTSARELCEKMAALNGVSLKIHEHCSKSTVEQLENTERSLVICDCEGYEAKIFDDVSCAKLRAHDLLIECHDFVDIEITPTLSTALQNTHNIEIIESVDDIIKAYTYSYPELENFSLFEKKEVFAERRPGTMRWIVAKSRMHGDSEV